MTRAPRMASRPEPQRNTAYGTSSILDSSTERGPSIGLSVESSVEVIARGLRIRSPLCAGARRPGARPKYGPNPSAVGNLASPRVRCCMYSGSPSSSTGVGGAPGPGLRERRGRGRGVVSGSRCAPRLRRRRARHPDHGAMLGAGVFLNPRLRLQSMVNCATAMRRSKWMYWTFVMSCSARASAEAGCRSSGEPVYQVYSSTS